MTTCCFITFCAPCWSCNALVVVSFHHAVSFFHPSDIFYRYTQNGSLQFSFTAVHSSTENHFAQTITLLYVHHLVMQTACIIILTLSPQIPPPHAGSPCPIWWSDVTSLETFYSVLIIWFIIVIDSLTVPCVSAVSLYLRKTLFESLNIHWKRQYIRLGKCGKPASRVFFFSWIMALTVCQELLVNSLGPNYRTGFCLFLRKLITGIRWTFFYWVLTSVNRTTSCFKRWRFLNTISVLSLSLQRRPQ